MERPHLIPVVVAIVMLIGAFGGHPYSYFELLRWIVTAAAAVSAYVAWQTERVESTVVFGIVAVVFNPFFPVYLDRSTWLLIDVIAAGLLAAGLRLRLSPSGPNP